MIAATKRFARSLEQKYLLSRGVHHFRGALDHGAISPVAIAEIWLGWGNTGFSASPAALLELARIAHSLGDQTILELGGGVSTLVLGLLAETTRSPIVTIESDATWCDDLRRRLARFGLTASDIRYAPLQRTGDGEWYDLASLPKAGSIGLVFCDGPPGNTPGGRAGVLSALAPILPDSAYVVIDDTNREAEDDIARLWAERHGRQRTRFTIGRDRAFDVLLPRA